VEERAKWDERFAELEAFVSEHDWLPGSPEPGEKAPAD